MKKLFCIWVCKLTIFIAKLCGKKGTNAAGKLAFKIYPDILKQLALGVKKEIIGVMGTNGKTTTNNILCCMLEEAGYHVVCNKIGANMDEGIATAFIAKTNFWGRLRADYACLEMDEQWAETVLKSLTPSMIIVTNLFRDQLDRYGEIDITGNFITSALKRAPEARLILNSDDPLMVNLGDGVDNEKIYFGINSPCIKELSEIREGRFCMKCKNELKYNFYHYSQLGDYYCEDCGFKRPIPTYHAKNIKLAPSIRFSFYKGNEEKLDIAVSSRGMYNIYNIMAALSVADIYGISKKDSLSALKSYRPQIGRMEKFDLGKEVYLILAKNPAGFNQSVGVLQEDAEEKDVIIAINDGIQDGTDISWLWDVDFERLRDETIDEILVSGKRLGDMALRLKYADIDMNKVEILVSIREGIERLAKKKTKTLYILVNYTALFSTQAVLKDLEKRWKNAGN